MAASGLSATQKGKAVESLVALSLMLASDGRLSPFVPVSDDYGIDLLVTDKMTHRVLPLQVKSRIAKASCPTVQFDVKKCTLTDLPNRYLLAVLFDPASITMSASWLIPMAMLKDISSEKPRAFSVIPRVVANEKDRYRAFRHDTVVALVDAILEVLSLSRPSRPEALG